jgi:hypothetical protein
MMPAAVSWAAKCSCAIAAGDGGGDGSGVDLLEPGAAEQQQPMAAAGRRSRWVAGPPARARTKRFDDDAGPRGRWEVCPATAEEPAAEAPRPPAEQLVESGASALAADDEAEFKAALEAYESARAAAARLAVTAGVGFSIHSEIEAECEAEGRLARLAARHGRPWGLRALFTFDAAGAGGLEVKHKHCTALEVAFNCSHHA